MPRLRFEKPSQKYVQDIILYKHEFEQIGDNLSGCSNLDECTKGEEWIDFVTRCESKDTCPEGYADATTYLAIRESDERLIGVINLRHELNNPILRVWGGHIGYSVRPSERRKGYGKEMLKMILPICKDRGLSEVLVVCLEHNVASETIILANGGVLESIIEVEEEKYKRYWISL